MLVIVCDFSLQLGELGSESDNLGATSPQLAYSRRKIAIKMQDDFRLRSTVC